MSLGLTIFTIIHVIISLIGIFSGVVVLAGLLTARRFDGWTAIFLSSTVLTSVTGFFFPFHHFTPAHGVGILSLLVLSITLYARYGQKLAGYWRWAYVVTAMLALYLNLFVIFALLPPQGPSFKANSPAQKASSFNLTQLTV